MMYDLRFGTPDDTAAIVDFILAAGGGIFEQLIDRVVPNLDVRDLLALAVNEEDSPFNFRNCLLAESGGRCEGMALCYPAEKYGLPPIAQGVLPEDRIAPLREILESRIEGSYYLNTLAVVEESARQGLGRMLLETAAEVGATLGFTAMSLHAWSDNARGIRFYESMGFRIARLIEVPSLPRLRHAGSMALMQVAIGELAMTAKRPLTISR